MKVGVFNAKATTKTKAAVKDRFLPCTQSVQLEMTTNIVN